MLHYQVLSCAFFDLDGTLTRRDTMFDFLRFYAGRFRFFLKMVLAAPILILEYGWRRDEQMAKERLLSLFLKGQKREHLEKAAELYVDRLDSLIRQEVWDRLIQLKNSGVSVFIVTASLDIWVSPWCRKHGLELISSRALWRNDFFTGRLEGANCRGEEKVRRIHEYFGAKLPPVVEAWGDARSDIPMLRMAQKAYFKNEPIVLD